MLNELIHSIKYIFIPPFCAHCRSFLKNNQEVLCSDCMGMIKPIVTLGIKISPTITVPVFAVSNYQEPLRSLITAKHYRNRYASTVLGQLIWQKTALPYADFDYIVPIPLHWTRYAWRWYNQADAIAQVLSVQSGKPVLHALKRVIKTQSQAGLTQEERKENIKKSFLLAVDKKLYKNKKFLLVDDVMTTGSTITHAIKALSSLEPAAIIVAVACRVV